MLVHLDEVICCVLDEFSAAEKAGKEVTAIFGVMVRCLCQFGGVSENVLITVLQCTERNPHLLKECEFLLPFTTPASRKMLREIAITQGNFAFARSIARQMKVDLSMLELLHLAQNLKRVDVGKEPLLVFWREELLERDWCEFERRRILKLLPPDLFDEK